MIVICSACPAIYNNTTKSYNIEHYDITKALRRCKQKLCAREQAASRATALASAPLLVGYRKNYKLFLWLALLEVPAQL